MLLDEWFNKWNIPPEAAAELRSAMGALPEVTSSSGDGEAMVQSKVRLRGAQLGISLWRNNVGVLKDEHSDRPVRFGLANDSKRINNKIKSGDLIGIRPVTITSEMVGRVIGQFVSLEVKPAGWKFSGNTRETAQQRWIYIITSNGGYAKFITGEDQL